MQNFSHALMCNNQSTNQHAAQSCSFTCTFLCSEEALTAMAESVEGNNIHRSHQKQGSYRSWKTWKVMEFKYFSFQAWKVMEFNCWLWKGMENYSVCGTEIIAGVD